MVDIHRLQFTTSTNKIAYEMALQGEPHGVCVIAEAQGAGRGRLGKVWESPPGKGLYCSIIVRPQLSTEEYPRITLAAGLAVALGLEEVTGHPMFLKWPNDVYAHGRKCAGILTESSLYGISQADRFAIVGIGINVNSESIDFPSPLREKVVSLRMLTGELFDIEAIFQTIRRNLMEKIALMEAGGFGEILFEWRNRDMLAGKWLQWLSVTGQVVFGQSHGPDEEGRLVITDRDGCTHQILSGDITLAPSE